jgi:hypothetical protein
MAPCRETAIRAALELQDRLAAETVAKAKELWERIREV